MNTLRGLIVGAALCFALGVGALAQGITSMFPGPGTPHSAGGGGTLALGASCTNNTSGGGQSLGCTLSTQGSSGVLVMQALINPNPTPTAATDYTVASTNLGSWGTKRANSAASGDIIIEFTKPFTTTDTSDTVTFTTTQAIAFLTICVWEIKNAATSSYFDAGGPVANTGPDPQAITTSTANDFVFAGYRMATQGSPTAGTGWTTICTGNFEVTEYQVVSSTGTYTAHINTGIGEGDANGAIVDAIHN